jgi:hypothetical protein
MPRDRWTIRTSGIESFEMKKHCSRIVSGIRSGAAPLAMLLLLLICTERPAAAYVDPGSGALVWQGMLASLLGAAFYFRRSLAWVRHKVLKAKPIAPGYGRQDRPSKPAAR